jgi:hypothetical protein
VCVGVWERIKNKVFNTVRRLPMVQRYIKKQLIGVVADVYKEVHQMDERGEFVTRLPDDGLSAVSMCTHSKRVDIV